MVIDTEKEYYAHAWIHETLLSIILHFNPTRNYIDTKIIAILLLREVYSEIITSTSCPVK